MTRHTTIEITDHTLMFLARLPFNKNCATWEECINNMLGMANKTDHTDKADKAEWAERAYRK